MGHCIVRYSLFRATTSCRPGGPSARGPAGEWYPHIYTFPFIGSQASEGEALREPNTKAPGGCGSFAPPADGWVCG